MVLPRAGSPHQPPSALQACQSIGTVGTPSRRRRRPRSRRAPPPTAFTPQPRDGAKCTDKQDWVDSAGDDCETYERYNWCPQYEDFGRPDTVKPKEACCPPQAGPCVKTLAVRTFVCSLSTRNKT